MAVAGRLIGLAVQGSFVRCEVSSTINFTRENLPASAEDSGGWKEFISGDRGWTISVNAGLLLEAVGADIKTVLLTNYFDDIPLFVQWATRPDATTELIFSGAALFTSADITAAAGESANYNVQLQGTGPLSKTLQDYDLLIDAMPPEADWPIIVDENI